MGRRASAVDANQADIVSALRSVGVSVFCTHAVGKGFPDLVCGRNGVTYLLEVKDGRKVPSARKLTDKEAEFMANWRGHYAVVETRQQAMQACDVPIITGLPFRGASS